MRTAVGIFCLFAVLAVSAYLACLIVSEMWRFVRRVLSDMRRHWKVEIPTVLSLFLLAYFVAAPENRGVALLLAFCAWIGLELISQRRWGCLFLMGFACLFGVSFLPLYNLRMNSAYYTSEALCTDISIRDRIDRYQAEHGRLPFDDAEIGSTTTWRTSDDGARETFRRSLDASVLDADFGTNDVLALVGVSTENFVGRWLTPDQVQIACLATGGNTNGSAYAVGFFGNRKNHPKPGTGFASIEAWFPDVQVPAPDGGTNRGYKIVATWMNYSCNGSVRGEQIRFGLEPEKGVCMLIPPEAFKLGAVTKLRGDGPDSVEYWVNRLRSAPCGTWNIPNLPER